MEIVAFGAVRTFFASPPCLSEPYCVKGASPSKTLVGTPRVFQAKNVRDVVVVLEPVLDTMPSRIASSLESDARFSDGTWHINRIGHRCRRVIGDSEARAESWIGSMGDIWDPKQGLGEAALSNRLALRVGGFRGDERDEYIVDRVAEMTAPSRSLFSEVERNRLRRQGQDPEEIQRKRLETRTEGVILLDGAREISQTPVGRPRSIHAWSLEAQKARAAAVSKLALTASDEKALKDKLKPKTLRVPLHRAMGLRARRKFQHWTSNDAKLARRAQAEGAKVVTTPRAKSGKWRRKKKNAEA